MQHIQGILASTPQLRKPALPPVSVNSRSRYVIERKLSGAFTFELRAHNGSCLLTCEDDAASLQAVQELVERIRQLVTQSNAAVQSSAEELTVVCRQSLTGKWYFVVADGSLVLASSRPFDYRSRMEKALYAVRACAPGSRVVVEE